MRSASGSKASRVCMGLLVARGEFFPRCRNRLADPLGSRAAWDIVNSEDVIEFQEIENVLVKMRINASQRFELQFLQLTLCSQCNAQRFPDLFVRNAKRNPFANQICRGSKGIHVARLGGLLHALEIEFDRLHPSCDQWKQ